MRKQLRTSEQMSLAETDCHIELDFSELKKLILPITCAGYVAILHAMMEYCKAKLPADKYKSIMEDFAALKVESFWATRQGQPLWWY